ncbi:MAG: hypothetical protein ABJX32_12950 [Tateyamaria sp.]
MKTNCFAYVSFGFEIALQALIEAFPDRGEIYPLTPQATEV